MPLVIAEHTMGNWTDEEVLLHCAKEYADPSNYEPYEKDYGVGRPVMRTPHFARNPRYYAEQTLQFLAERKAVQKAPPEHYLPAVATGNGHCIAQQGIRAPDSPALHMQTAGRAYRLTPREKAYLKAYKLMCRLQAEPNFCDLPVDVQDEINSAAKECGKWI